MRVQLKIAILKRFGAGRQYEAARQIGVSEATLSRIVVGRRDPTVDERRALARVLRVPQRDLFPRATNESGDANS